MTTIALLLQFLAAHVAALACDSPTSWVQYDEDEQSYVAVCGDESGTVQECGY